MCFLPLALDGAELIIWEELERIELKLEEDGLGWKTGPIPKFKSFIQVNGDFYLSLRTAVLFIFRWVHGEPVEVVPACVTPPQGARPSARRSLWWGFRPHSMCGRTGRRRSGGWNPAGSEGCGTKIMLVIIHSFKVVNLHFEKINCIWSHGVKLSFVCRIF